MTKICIKLKHFEESHQECQSCLTDQSQVYLNTVSGCCVIFHAFVVCCFFFLQNNLFRKILSVTYSEDPDQAQHFVQPDLGPNCLQSYHQTHVRILSGGLGPTDSSTYNFTVLQWGVQWFILRKTVIFHGSRGGPTFSRMGVQLFPRVPHAHSYRT